MPISVYNQIDIAETSCVSKIEVYLKDYLILDDKIFLPKNCNQISDFEDYTGVYHDNYFFKIPRTIKHKTILFID